MELILQIATLLGGITAIWFFYDKRHVVSAWFKLKKSHDSVRSIFEVSDEDFRFIDANLDTLNKTGYIPIYESEKETCKSLSNQGILHRTFRGKYKFTSVGKSMIYK
ncbi:hypothetical protein [Pseudoalteromonas carrageenovora]|uniref:hypothetical protein n=1 Tax=Pseudoalteromonas carrageenovora TaxID=227 RepID=UPI0026E27BE2|nr:hypothetical protein [Pseudoalteromonas carrageenovora]MDO6545709.1 hypothetical protein [Pseudoalteromonas carrageenovora]MDO6830364.1 hypothetical protein [Pseudoalteromonas carrageenovora]